MKRVSTLFDGDTLRVSHRVNGSQYIRIAGLNAPEKGQRGYASAKNKLNKMKGKVVTIKPIGKSYGRTVADVIFK